MSPGLPASEFLFPTPLTTSPGFKLLASNLLLLQLVYKDDLMCT